MADALEEYRRKRDFGVTAEPAGSRRKRRRKQQALEFCIQKHAARRLHYDFRLELDGTLKSWAVPKGPSLDPKSRRLAVHVEDHPLEYADFEGEIAEGEYGAGQVIVWDRGFWIPEGDPVEGYRKGKLKFQLQGHKLGGRWNLVRTHMSGSKEQWFLIKSGDDWARPEQDYSITESLPDSVLSDRSLDTDSGKKAAGARSAKRASRQSRVRTPAPARPKPGAPELDEARKAPLPDLIKPQLATLADTVPDGDNWRYEIKFDGYRILARIDDGEVRLFTRNGYDWTDRMPRQAGALANLPVRTAWLDGEVVVPDPSGLPDFQALQNAFNEGQSGNILFYLFDLPYLDGLDLRRAPVEQRRGALARVLEHNDSELLRFSADFEESGEAMLNSACELQMEGLIGKRLGSRYTSRRSRDWIKLKCSQRQEFVIVGYTEPRNSRQYFGALLLGLYDSPGGALRYAGKVGTGFNSATLESVHRQLEPLAVKRPAVINPPTGADARGARWVQPQLLAEVAYAQMTREGVVRHAVFHGLREDKPARAVTKEKPAQPSRGTNRGKSATGASDGLVEISHPERVIDPTTGTTKQQLADFYYRIRDWIRPFLGNRPVAIVRAPEGITGELFFQKHGEKLKIPELVRLDKTYSGQPAMMINSPEALLGAVQMNTIELHTWNATHPDMARPDRFILDLDPDPALPWARMLEATQLTLTVLDELGLESFLKTSGGKGIHIEVPLIPRDDWDSVKQFSRAIVKHMARLLPDRFSAVSGPRNRVGRIFIDYLRNSNGATTICAFSVRARPGMAVSVPIRRDELEHLAGADIWTVHNLQKRLDQLERDPWDGYRETEQVITDDMRARLGLKN